MGLLNDGGSEQADTLALRKIGVEKACSEKKPNTKFFGKVQSHHPYLSQILKMTTRRRKKKRRMRRKKRKKKRIVSEAQSPRKYHTS
jgi:hypothetical protein